LALSPNAYTFAAALTVWYHFTRKKSAFMAILCGQQQYKRT